MVAFVSMHQDVWSRYSGGSGAPAWTLESVGFDLNALDETGAAWLNGVRKGGSHVDVAERGLWPTGYTKLAASTMAYVSSLYFGMGLIWLGRQNVFLGWGHFFAQDEGKERGRTGSVDSGIFARGVFGYVR